MIIYKMEKKRTITIKSREHEATNKVRSTKIEVGDIGTACDGHLIFVACCSVLSGSWSN
ncbi:hypothetical protein Bca101_054169 [Brassica carinata]